MAQHLRSDSKGHSNSLTPLISIIIPVYNVEQYIARCLESCIHQTLRNIEIIIVDDCGSDDSIAIAQHYADKDSRIRIIHNEKNLGTFHTRANGVRHAQAEFCMFADPDDFLAPKACEIAYNTITHHKVDMAHFSIAYEPKSLKRIKPIVHNGILKDDKMRLFLSGGNNTQGLWDKIYKTSILLVSLKKLDFFTPPLNMLEDGLLVLVASMESHSYFGQKTCIYHYCNNPSSITKCKDIETFTLKQQHFDKLLSITQKLLSLYPKHTLLLTKYRHKVASTLMIESRDFSHNEFYTSLQILHKHGLDKHFDLPPYVKSTLLSLRYAFRWQNLIRLLAFIGSFGKVRL
ncbi:glycosyltransferase family 2 protein [Helicobacter cinaedi]|uniref:glycosyltransferase family 2 protein n=1 Tax=Helicobacter cinaedi TaxID=213 RepID=UPI000CF1B86D|nr:glycosyltransferase family 2 protein [Helicobacter cinaedi]